MNRNTATTMLAALAFLAIATATMPPAAASGACVDLTTQACDEVVGQEACLSRWHGETAICASPTSVCQTDRQFPDYEWCALVINRGPTNYVCVGPPIVEDETCVGGHS